MEPYITNNVISWLKEHPGKKIVVEIIDAITDTKEIAELNGLHSNSEQVNLCAYRTVVPNRFPAYPADGLQFKQAENYCWNVYRGSTLVATISYQVSARHNIQLHTADAVGFTADELVQITNLMNLIKLAENPLDVK